MVKERNTIREHTRTLRRDSTSKSADVPQVIILLHVNKILRILMNITALERRKLSSFISFLSWLQEVETDVTEKQENVRAVYL